MCGYHESDQTEAVGTKSGTPGSSEDLRGLTKGLSRAKQLGPNLVPWGVLQGPQKGYFGPKPTLLGPPGLTEDFQGPQEGLLGPNPALLGAPGVP